MELQQSLGSLASPDINLTNTSHLSNTLASATTTGTTSPTSNSNLGAEGRSNSNNSTTTCTQLRASIDSDLSTLEQVMMESSNSLRVRGRAAFDSVSTQLGSLRQRLRLLGEHMTNTTTNNNNNSSSSSSNNNNTNGTDISPLSSPPPVVSYDSPIPTMPLEVTSTPASWQQGRGATMGEQQFVDTEEFDSRLAQAELAHSTGIPLSVLRSGTLQDSSSTNSEIAKPKEEAENSQALGHQGGKIVQQEENMSDEPENMDSISEGVLKKENSTRRQSALLASRNRMEELTAVDVEMLQGVEVTLTPLPEDLGRHIESNDVEVEVDEIQAPEIPVLLTVKSQERLNTSNQVSGSILMKQSVSPAKSTDSCTLFSWGSGMNSLHDDSNDRTITDAEVSTTSRAARYIVMSVAVGSRHSAMCTSSGEILACGANECGQVDPDRLDVLRVPKPSLVEALCMTRVIQVACGCDHTAALTISGTVLTWGNNSAGQLGHARTSHTKENDSATIRGPAAMVLGAGRRAASIACGYEFTLVLTTRMTLLACGSSNIVPTNSDGSPRLPCSLPALEALPIASIAAGARHAVVVTCHGTAYVWGVNDAGCCGRRFPVSIAVPVPFLLSTDLGKTCSEGPTLFPNWAAWDGPREPVSLWDDVAVAQAACGAAHTVLVTRSGRLLVCGQNEQGQLGFRSDSETVSCAQVVNHPTHDRKFIGVAAGTSQTVLLDDVGDVWTTGDGKLMERVLTGKRVIAITCGGEHSVAIAEGVVRPVRQFSLDPDADVGISLAQSMETLVENIAQGGEYKDLVARTEELFRCPAVMNSLLLDPEECDHLYQHLVSIGPTDVREAIARAIEKGMQKGLDSLRSSEARLMYPEAVRCLLLYLQCPLFRDWKSNNLDFDFRANLIISLCETIISLPFEGYRALMTWATSLYQNPNYRNLLINPLLAQLERGLMDGDGARARAIPLVVMVLRWLHKAAEQVTNVASPSDFHCAAICQLKPELLYDDLRKHKAASSTQRSQHFFLCAHPFLMSPTCKRNLLQIEHQVEMMRAATANLTWDLQHHQFVFDPYFVLAVDRAHLLQQTLQKISAASASDLRKSLKVVFKGEPGVDAGGVTREFFLLLCSQLFDYDTGMWTTRFGSSISWFNSDCTWNDDGYYLVGVLVGLAVYNNVLLDVNFPHVLYRKLLGQPLGLEDVADEALKAGLRQLLDYSGEDLESVFCLTFSVTWMDLGVERSVELKPGGSNIAVTSENREDYVLRYVKWLLVDSIHRQYDHFERGVMHVLESSSLDLLRPDELELLVVGTPELDFLALQKNTEYDGGYSQDSPVIKNFWHFVQEADSETKLKLLKFATGTSKAPIGGLATMPFKIQRAGPDSIQLPTSHTCFNTLLLPDYGSDFDKLATLLGRAVMECEGFGLQ